MSAFGIFALVLTVAYIIYYGFMLAYDQYGVRSDSGHDTSEVISVPGATRQETSRQVVNDEESGAYRIYDEDEQGDAYPEAESDEDIDDTGWGGSPDAGDTPAGGAADGGEERSGEGAAGGGAAAAAEEKTPEEVADSRREFEKVRDINSGLPTVVPRYEEEYDLSSMMVLMMQPEDMPRASRVTFKDISEGG